ncbi:uncharacterized protein F5147DRAFT_650235 [Suillus discolor]|uniref:Uncharacterized protein n=1 Tax=Suillus discolor TaxID=1912936 RepID=A0A9P7FEP9_9AGAM|nr:uncharacterized protein F5147DRAFT_650235 [Suillus discolor]KAG2113825.1 hypothetical protein F5147DRAFT_650235 [Suillus discolor]
MDVDNKNDYVEMAKKIILEKLKKVKIFIDMKNVEKLPVYTHETGASELESIVKDWTCAMHDGEATTSMPPNIQSFNPAKREPALHPMRCAALTTPMAPPAPLTTIQDLAHNQDHAAISSTPLPTVNTFVLARSPAILTPSKLTRFLNIGAGLDILAKIADHEHTHIRLTLGDIIHLKKGSVTWWSCPLAKSEPMDSIKHKYSDTTGSGIPEDRKYQYKKRYHDGGRA